MIPLITTCNVTNRRVFLRIDGNIPISNGAITNDFRLRAVLPTITYLLARNATITIGTHLGRPHKIEEGLSTKPIAHWFASRGIRPITVLENLRFDPREKKHDITFAQELAAKHDIYVSDAWGALHRDETSITLLPTLFSPQNRAFGLLVERELTALTPLRNGPRKPYIVFLGGGKQKFEVLHTLIEQGHVTAIVLLPGIVFTFLAAQGISVGRSLIFPEQLESCRMLFTHAQRKGIAFIMPNDFLVEDGGNLFESTTLEKTATGITIGTQTCKHLRGIIEQAATIFYNGAMGYGEEGDVVLKRLLTDIAASKAETIIGGGDSVAAAERFGLSEKYRWCSTGGGSTLVYISGGRLPGLEALIN